VILRTLDFAEALANADRGFALLKQQNLPRHDATISMSANNNFPELILHQPWQGTCSALW
jgi:hypothetical protein